MKTKVTIQKSWCAVAEHLTLHAGSAAIYKKWRFKQNNP